MAEPEDIEEDLFADLYDGDDASKPGPLEHTSAHVDAEPKPSKPVIAAGSSTNGLHSVSNEGHMHMETTSAQAEDVLSSVSNSKSNGSMGGVPPPGYSDFAENNENYGPVGIKEDGKMFIGGLNWETTDQSLKDYFSQFGEVIECTVMRDGATGRSRGFGFLTFKDPKTVNIVMVKEHYLDGKIIDPKRAIPREEQEKTSKIFVGGVSQEATEQDFKHFFMQFGRVIDATLMMDKDTGRPRGFGFVTFDGDAAVDAALAQPLEILGKPIEVKRAQPRGNMHDDEAKGGKFTRGGKFGHQGAQGGFDGQQAQAQSVQGQNGMTPSMMAQYWARMQAYFAAAQANLAQQQGVMGNPMMGGGMNPGMNPGMGPGMGLGMAPGMNQMQQMMAMQAMQRNETMSPSGGSSNSQSQVGTNMASHTPPGMMGQVPTGPSSFQGNQGGASGQAGAAARPAFNAQEQLMFEQQKYQNQEAQARQRQYYGGAYANSGPSTWDGMYDDVPQPNMPGPHMSGGSGPGPMRGGGRGGLRGGINRGGGGVQAAAGNAPANAPTGPKNAGRPGANYRGGGRGSHRGFHPYAR